MSKIIYENEYFTFYLTGDNLTNIHLDSKSKEEQEIISTYHRKMLFSKLNELSNLLKIHHSFIKTLRLL